MVILSDRGRITDVVNIGIGGSDLGPVMATLALAPYHDGQNVILYQMSMGRISAMFCGSKLERHWSLWLKTFTTMKP